MTINVIQQTTAERKQETIKLYNTIKPAWDNGTSIYTAVITLTDKKPYNAKNGWYRDLIEYAKSQGFDHNGTKWQRGKKQWQSK